MNSSPATFKPDVTFPSEQKQWPLLSRVTCVPHTCHTHITSFSQQDTGPGLFTALPCISLSLSVSFLTSPYFSESNAKDRMRPIPPPVMPGHRLHCTAALSNPGGLGTSRSGTTRFWLGWKRHRTVRLKRLQLPWKTVLGLLKDWEESHRVTHQLLSGGLSEGNGNTDSKPHHSPRLTAVLWAVARIWQPPRGPWTDERIKKRGHTCTMGVTQLWIRRSCHWWRHGWT